MKTIEIPDELAKQVLDSGVDLQAFVLSAVKDRLSSVSGVTFGQRMSEGWQPPVVMATVDQDSVTWSEVEAPCDPS